MRGINTNGVYDAVGLIQSIVVDLGGNLEVRGVENMKIVFDSINKLDALKRVLEKQKEGETDVSITDGQGQNV